MIVLAAAALLVRPTPLGGWGEHGHRLVGDAAAAALPPSMPAFFRRAGARLAYLNPEPDRWRAQDERALDPALSGGSAPDHYVNFERVPAERRAGFFAAGTRYEYVDSLHALGADAAAAGFLPFRILELTQRLRVGFRAWRSAPNDSARAWAQQRVVDDAGVLGHYVADGSNPAHTTVHHNGRVGENPDGYATDARFHGRFESAFVEAHVTADDVRAATRRAGVTPRAFPDVRAATLAYLESSHALVDSLYRLDKAAPFDTTAARETHRRFAADRLAAGAMMLRDLWWTAWVTSAW